METASVEIEDRDGLGPSVNNRLCTIGHVDHVNGEGSEPVPEYPITRHELIRLARYWFEVVIGNNEAFEETGATGSTEWRETEYGERRLHRIAEILGDDEMNEIRARMDLEKRLAACDDEDEAQRIMKELCFGEPIPD